MSKLRTRITELTSSQDMVEELIKGGMRRDVAERVANSGGVLASRLLRQKKA